MRNTHVSLWHLGNSKLFLSFPEGIQKREPKKKTAPYPQSHYLPSTTLSIGTGKKIQEKIIQARLFQEEDLFVVCSPTLSTAISQTIEGSGRVWAWQGCGGPGVAGIHGSPTLSDQQHDHISLCTFTSHSGKLGVIGTVHVPHLLASCWTKWKNAKNYPPEIFRWRKFVAAIFHWSFFGCNFWNSHENFVFEAHRTYGTKVVYLPFYHILLTFRISINFPEKSTKQKPFVPCFFLVGDFQQRFPGVQLRNRLAKLEQALRNKDEPGDHRFASKIIETVGMFLDFLCFWLECFFDRVD